jgi:hypothetical protein
MVKRKLHNNIKTIIREAEKLNKSKVLALTALEDKLKNCQVQLILPIMRHIELIRANIVARQKLIDELKSIVLLTSENKIHDIICKLEKLDNEDSLSMEMCLDVINKLSKHFEEE